MATFYVARHGQTLLNALGRAQGWCDSPLTTEGEDTAAGLGSLLANVPLHAAYASDTMRAVQTARICLEAAGQGFCPIVEDARLREWCLGSMEAESNDVFARRVSEWIGPPNSLDDMNRRLPEIAEALRAHDETCTAESFQSIANRAMGFLIALIASYLVLLSYPIIGHLPSYRWCDDRLTLPVPKYSFDEQQYASPAEPLHSHRVFRYRLFH